MVECNRRHVEIAPNVHVISGGMVNCFLIVDPDGLTLVDTGLAGNANKVLKYVEGLGRKPGDVKRILITHADGDHVGSLAALKAATGARVYASAAEATAIAAGRSSRDLKANNLLLKLVFAITRRLFKASPAQVDEIVAEGQVLPALGGLRVVETFGHTPGHISLFAPSSGILFVGDSLVSDKKGLHGSLGANTWDQDKADASVRKQAALGASIVCSGHGPVVMDAATKFPQI
jgi:glyoxylase-like metal-dependent hydrolase (beta-lactamase superfamily II)